MNLASEIREGWKGSLTDCPGVLKAAGRDVRALPILRPSETLSINTMQELAAVEVELEKSRTTGDK